MDQTNLYNHPTIRLLKKAIQREKWWQLFFSMLLFSGSILLLVFFFERNIFLNMLGLIGSVLGVKFMFSIVKYWRADNSRLLRLLRYQPQNIVWVYSILTSHLPFGFQFSRNTTLYFKLIDGDEITVGINPKDLKKFMLHLNRMLPHATFGYSNDKAQWYRASPLMLLNDNKNDQD